MEVEAGFLEGSIGFGIIGLRVFISGVMSPLIWVLHTATLLITPL